MKTWFFQESNKTDKPLVKLIKRNRKTQINKNRTFSYCNSCQKIQCGGLILKDNINPHREKHQF